MFKKSDPSIAEKVKAYNASKKSSKVESVDTDIVEETQSEENTQPNMDRTAISAFRNPTTNQWCIEVVKYDAVKGVCEVVSLQDAYDKSSAQQDFKLKAVKLLPIFKNQ